MRPAPFPGPLLPLVATSARWPQGESSSRSRFLMEHDPSGRARGHAFRKTGGPLFRIMLLFWWSMIFSENRWSTFPNHALGLLHARLAAVRPGVDPLLENGRR